MKAFHGNRRRCRTGYGKLLGRRRSEIVERAFAHVCVSGAFRRVSVRGLINANKRYLLHVAAYNLGIVMRSVIGCGTPRERAERLIRTLFMAYLLAWYACVHDLVRNLRAVQGR